MKRRLLVVVVCLLLLNALGAFAEEGMSDLTYFQSMMMESVSSQLTSATDLTLAERNRATLAALLTLEYYYQDNSREIDYSKPIFVGKKDATASCAFAVGDDYVVVMFQMHPTTTCYGRIYDCDPVKARISMEMASDEAWPVSIDLYNEMLAEVVDQIS
ncbi:MAG: hypothetical protein E7317_00405 [Clostridiales bacterium]|nr:hypothetical protein [Clostridiales bacterium]